MKRIFIALLSITLLLSACSANKNLISEDEAKKIAMSHSEITDNELIFSKSERDKDDGRILYEIEIHTKDFKEYDYEIDAESGEIVSYDVELKNPAPNKK